MLITTLSAFLNLDFIAFYKEYTNRVNNKILIEMKMFFIKGISVSADQLEGPDLCSCRQSEAPRHFWKKGTAAKQDSVLSLVSPQTGAS